MNYAEKKRLRIAAMEKEQEADEALFVKGEKRNPAWDAHMEKIYPTHEEKTKEK